MKLPKHRVRIALRAHDVLDKVVEYRRYNSYLLIAKHGIDEEFVRAVEKMSGTYSMMVQTPLWFNITDYDSQECKDSREFVLQLSEMPNIEGLLITPTNAFERYTELEISDILAAWINGPAQAFTRRDRYVLIQNASHSANRLSFLSEIRILSFLRTLRPGPYVKLCWSPENTLTRVNRNPQVISSLLPLMKEAAASIRVHGVLSPPLTYKGSDCSWIQIASAMPKAEIIVARKLLKSFQNEVEPYV